MAKTINDVVGGMDKISKNITPKQADEITSVLNLLSKLEKKK